MSLFSCLVRPRTIALHIVRHAVGAVDGLHVPGCALGRRAADDPAGVHDVENGHDEEHESGVEDVEENLGGLQVAVEALDVLDDAEDVSDQDDQRHSVQHQEVVDPGYGDGLGRGRRAVHDAIVEDARHDDEEAEEEQLHEEAAQDHVLAELETVVVFGRGHETTAGTLL